MHRFDFSSSEYERFLDRCPFTDNEINVLNMRRRGKSVVEMCIALNVSEATLWRRIRSIQKKIMKEL